jgi:hypothetical protein
MRALFVISAIAALGLGLSACAVVDAGSAVIGAGADAVGTAASVTGDVVSAPFGGGESRQDKK